MTISEYIENLNERYQSGRSTEHSYRGDLLQLLESLLPNTSITNEPRRSEVGAPDYILTKKNVPIGFIEAKDIGDTDLKGKKKHKEQFDRYKATRDPFIFTDYLDFRFYNDEEFITSVRIAHIEGGRIVPRPGNFDQFRELIRDFATQRGQTIRSSSRLSKMMAGKARLLANIIQNALESDQKNGQVNEAANNTLREQMEAFKDVLIHDIDAKEFADIYAQTIAYGMFAARLHDPTLDSFSRHEAAELIPKTNPFLRKLFQYIAGYDLDDRITWVVDALADIFRATDVAKLMEDFGQATQQTDPVIHFYETFLAEFDPDLRKSRGVWYTPEPVVNFIVRAVDDILKEEFDLNDGLADTSKTTVKVKTDVKDGRKADGYKEEERELHKVQILDPAAGTGTFLAEVIRQIRSGFDGQEGLWPSYVENDLIPRLNGFELLMASYAMAHLKLDMLLKETGYDREASQRFRVYLTNSLEEHHPDTGTLFASWLSEEANQANHVKRDTPVMVVMGNPPYSVSSSNKGEWIKNLIADYKKQLQERKLNLDDDYIKFIRYGEHFIEKNGEGVLAYISNNSYLDGITHRRMREHLLKTFDEIYILNLHGDSKKGKSNPDGGKDENVFDIRQGVSINLFIKSNGEKDGCKVYYHDIFGLRDHKYESLSSYSWREIDWSNLKPKKPYYFLLPIAFNKRGNYESGFKLSNLYKEFSTGIETKCDNISINFSPQKAKKVLNDFLELDSNALKRIYKRKNSSGWNYSDAKDDLKNNDPIVTEISYRPFDIQFTCYTGSSSGFMGRPRSDIMSHLLKPNLSFCMARINRDYSSTFFITEGITDKSIVSSLDNIYICPLYLYQDSNQQTLDGQPERTPNLNAEIVQEVADGLGLTFVPEKETVTASEMNEEHEARHSPSQQAAFAPIDLLDYIYAVLHSPTYREKYKEFLKIDFPRVPYPTDAETFWQLVELGGQLRRIHLLEHPIVDEFITTYPEPGSNEITKRLTKTDPGFILYEKDDEEPTHTGDDHRYPNERLGKIQINKEQHFGMVPEKAWNFYIGGYQPAEKWLKDRRDRELSPDEIRHYQKIIVALMETDRIMGEIDEIEIE